MSYDVITLGETMLRLTPPGLQRFEQGQSLAMHIGGSESNVAVGLSRLGLRTAWLSRLTNNALGQKIARGIRANGVDVSHVVWTDDDRIGLYFYEAGRPPRSGTVIYDRANSAMSRMQPDDLPDIFQPETAQMLHLSGISLAIGDAATETAMSAAARAKNAGWLLSFDINHRALLWSSEEAASACDPVARMADIVFLPLRDARALYHTDDTPETAIRTMSDRYPQALIVLTLGAEGAMAFDGTTLIKQAAFKAEPVQRIGGGDAFVAGFLYGYYTEQTVAPALRWGAATAAMKYAIAGDMPLIHRAEVQALVQSGQHSGLLR
jgi:2-dehydro-3-deoxygluconokinase